VHEDGGKLPKEVGDGPELPRLGERGAGEEREGAEAVPDVGPPVGLDVADRGDEVEEEVPRGDRGHGARGGVGEVERVGPEAGLPHDVGQAHGEEGPVVELRYEPRADARPVHGGLLGLLGVGPLDPPQGGAAEGPCGGGGGRGEGGAEAERDGETGGRGAGAGGVDRGLTVHDGGLSDPVEGAHDRNPLAPAPHAWGSHRVPTHVAAEVFPPRGGRGPRGEGGGTRDGEGAGRGGRGRGGGARRRDFWRGSAWSVRRGRGGVAHLS